MAIENVNEVKEYLEANKDNEEVKSLFTGLIPKEGLDGFLDGEDGKKLLQPKLDKYFTKGLETWKANNLSKIVDDEVAKRNPAESPEAKQIRELQDKLNNMEKSTVKEKLRSNALKALADKGMPSSLADYINADTDEGVNYIISTIEIEWKKQLETMVTARLKGKTPPAQQSNGTSGIKPDITKEQFVSLPMADRVKLFNENPELFNKIMKS